MSATATPSTPGARTADPDLLVLDEPAAERAALLAIGAPIAAERLAGLAARVSPVGSRSSLDVLAPYSGEVVGRVPSCTEADVEHAFTQARKAQAAWAQTSFDERARVLRRLSHLVLERRDEVLDIMQLETGKARTHAFEEVADTAIVANYYARTGERHLAPARREGALPLLTQTRELHVPKGVVGFIAPWNYPLSMAITDAIPALMAGNAAVVKPDSQTPYTALWIAELFEEAGLPADLLHVVTGSGSVVGSAIIQQADFVTFTGSTATGRLVAGQCAERLIGCALELGGKNALLVLDDADVDRAVEVAVRGSFANAGQLCISFERIYVPAAMRATFLERFAAAAESLELAGAFGWAGDMGSLISADQLATVRAHVEDAVEKGATVVTGGMARPDVGPWFHAPTVLTDVTPAMELAAEETFGPVVSVYAYDALEEAVRRVNDSRYGLNAAVVSSSARRGREVGERLEAGTVNVNEAYAAAWASPDAPMGGVKDSGLGRRHGAQGITKYTESRTVAVQRLLPVSDLPLVSEEMAAKVLSVALNVMFRVPGLRR